MRNSSITSIMEYNNDTLLVSTLKNGLFLMVDGKLYPKKTSLDATFHNDRIYYMGKIAANKYVVGTTSGGVFIMNKEGLSLQEYKYKDGLQNNNVRGGITDKDGNLWLALDDGIDFIAIIIDNIQIFEFIKENKGFEVWPFDKKFHILLNVAVGGDWGGSKV